MAERRRLIVEVATFVAVLGLVLFLMFRSRPPASYNDCRVAMGTVVSIAVFGMDDDVASSMVDVAWREIALVESTMTRYSGASEVERLNAHGGGVASRAVVDVVSRALDAAAMSGGAFDPTVGPLSDLWDFRDDMELPEHAALLAALERVGHERVTVDTASLSVELGGAELDLDGIAKGHAVDRAVTALQSMGVPAALVDAGGDIRTVGVGPRRGRWRIGVKDPRDEGLLGVLTLETGSVATSGDYQRCGFVDGVRYHHILSPRTGYPARGVMSATVVCDDCILADALATAVFVMGPSEGMRFIENRDGVEGVIVSGDEETEEVLVSSGLSDRFELAR